MGLRVWPPTLPALSPFLSHLALPRAWATSAGRLPVTILGGCVFCLCSYMSLMLSYFGGLGWGGINSVLDDIL